MTKSIEETYQKKTQLEHVLHRPGMYIGDTDKTITERWVITEDSKMVRKNINISPGLYKIFDEILTNALDHSQRDPTMKKIEVTVLGDEITVLNDGTGIPIEIHRDLGKYVPEIIFGEFHTSSNYDDTEARTVGGLNGYGSKLTNAFSTKFTVEICDSKHCYTQTWKNNMSEMTVAKVISCKKKAYTKISFIPDYSRFGMESLDPVTVNLFKTRVYEGACIAKLNISFNDVKVPIKSFEDYIDLFIGKEPRVYEKIGDRWEMAIALNSHDKFMQVSFVNGISTSEGGTHIDYLINQVIYKLKEQLEKKHKDLVIRPAYIKDNIQLFVKCLIENPTFSSQTKEQHVTKSSKFGSVCIISDDLLKKIDRLGITANVIDVAKAKDQKSLSKTDGKKQFRLTGIPKLDDANKAGGVDGSKCKLILTEGDSAKASAVAGLSVVGRDYYGIFPLRGKLLNVRDATSAQLLKNEEINNLKKILGLQQGKEYTTTKSLRYGGIMIFTDADNDGSHIKGLIINFIHTFWPSLLNINSFISCIVTPIVKITKGVHVKSFYTQSEFINWKNSGDISKWNIKYYKGLGTSTAKEAKEYFTNLQKQTIIYNTDKHTDDDLIKAFKKGFEDSRKEWIKENTGKNTSLDFTVLLTQSISHFVNKELINFSIADLERSIPNMMDGFKPSQRKVLFGCIKKGVYTDIKVAQLSGYISEHTSYHHGEVSLQGTIINMAQDYVGSNNINLLVPSGQFGTRLLGGKDSGSPRYIFTHLQPITKILFNDHDSKLLDYLDDDGMAIEPKYYIPLIPLILVNGSEGIGTGYSTNIPCYNPDDIITNLKKLIDSDGTAELLPMVPWYRGFKGEIVQESEHKYISTGCYTKLSNGIEINELPIGKWTQTYKEFLETLVESNDIIDYKNNCDDTSVNFKVILQKSIIDNLSHEDIVKKLKLTSSISTTNMHVFDSDCKIRKIQCPEEIIFRFYQVRKEHFIKRKKYLIKKLTGEFELMDSKIKFIKLVIDEKIIIFNKKKDFIIKQINEYSLVKVNGDYDYLLDMKLFSLTSEKIEKLVMELEKITTELEKLKRTSISETWNSELLELTW